MVLADLPNEAGAFALAGFSMHNDRIDILVRRPINVPTGMMRVQNEYHLEISPQAINGLISLCEVNKLGAVICHSHPAGLQYSPSDDFGEARIANTLRQYIPPGTPIASLLFTPDEVTGRVWMPAGRAPERLDEIIVIGHSINRIRLKTTKRGEARKGTLELYDRQVRAFGTEGQKLISETKVGIIGVGGTGSPVAEQLARLGVVDFVLVDPDTFSLTNLTRVYGTTFTTVKKAKRHVEYKVDLIADHLKNINPGISIRALRRNVVDPDACSALLDRDVIFLCTDEHWGRSVVNQLSYQYMIPVINLGVSVASTSGTITGAVGALDILRPGKPCLWCKQFLQARRISAESMSAENRKGLLQEGYVEDIDTPTPSVISFTSSMASMAVSIFLHMVTNFMGESGDISRINVDFLTGESRRGRTQIGSKCICKKVKGFGDLIPLPTVKGECL
jgi:molybdopterin/thiamine biosynthesis adenylyltransferase